MRCPKCGTENSDERRFCAECGDPLLTECPQCSFENQASANFCGGCGRPIMTAASAGLDLPAQPPPYLRDRILQARNTMLGERKRVTVLFADIKGSTALIEGMDPEQAAEQLEPVLAAMIDAVHQMEGTVNRIHGDGIMALFGAPIAYEDHAVRACHSALAMVDAVKAVSDDKISIRVGLNSGEVVMRSIANDMSMDYDAVGTTVHIAARMEQLAEPGRIYLTGETCRLAEGFIRTAQLETTAIKGLSAPVEMFELKGRTAVLSSWQVRAARGLTELVGRERELDRILAGFRKAVGGQGQVIALVGEPGMGKSRLVHEFIHAAGSDPAVAGRNEPVMVFETSAVSHGRNTAYFPVSNLFRAWFEIGSRDTRDEIARKVQDRVLALDEALEFTLRPLFSLLDLPVDDEWERLDPPQRRRRTHESITALTRHAAKAGPLVVVVEDLQWVDDETQALLDNMVEDLKQTPALLLVSYRPEYRHGWAPKDYHTEIRVGPLSEGKAAGLLDTLLGDDPGLDQLKRLAVERTEGTPLFLEETVRTLLETGVLEGGPGRYRLTQDVTKVEIPDTVQAMLAARIDRLRPGPRKLLQVASVIGTVAPGNLLHAVADFGQGALREWLTELEGAEFLFEARPVPNQEYRFKHALTHDVAYNSLLREERRALHAVVVENIEQLYADRIEEQVERLADHACRGGLWEAGLKYLRDACIRAISRSATREAVAIFERGLEVLEQLPEGKARAKAAIDLRLIVLNALIPLGEQERLVQHLREAEALAESLKDLRRIGLVASQLTVAQWMASDHERALEAGNRALDVANELDNQPLKFAALYNLGMVNHAFGNYDEAERLQRTLLENFPPAFEKERFGWAGYPSVLIRTFLAGTLVEKGAFEDAEGPLYEGCRIADEIGHPYSQAMIYGIVGHLAIERGQFDEAVEVLERILKICRDEEVWAMYPAIAARLGVAYTRAGKSAQAIETLEYALRPEIYRKGARYTWFYLYLAIAEAYLHAGRLGDALSHAKQAEALTRENRERGHHAHSLKLLGDIHAAHGPDFEDEALTCYRAALALAEERGMRPLLASCQLGLGERHLAAAEWPEARTHLGAAADLYRALGLDNALRQAEQGLQGVEVKSA